MAARVLFFGPTAEIAGRRLVEIIVTDGSTAASVLEKLVADYPGLSAHKLKISVNQAYASVTTLVQDGDELAVFTAVSGG